MSTAERQQCTHHYREADWIDYYAGQLSLDACKAMLKHKEDCRSCGRLAAEWELLLDEPGNNDRAAEAPSLMPGPAVRRSLRRQVRKQAVLDGIRSLAMRRRRWLTAAAAIVVLIGFIGLNRMLNEPANLRSDYVAEHEPTAVRFMNDPRTASYQVHPSGEELGEGFVWFNDDSSEVLVLLEGLLPTDNHDVQAWAVNDGNRENLGLLQHVEAGRAHLYLKRESLASATLIVLTVEPHGGSANPTMPEAFVIRLHPR
ncbi:anti-sigma factor [Paenibacillus silvisoli]|uniref:anti-sigma factor n=1 Tax=Paenibacillus silvisoli TaxID=3110539 RepID=UPI00280380B6|nr:anti-sigma factor [Paenibacillus silvisoli]